jgi:hypothetical protein
MKIVFKNKNITFIAFSLISLFCFLHLLITKDDIKNETKLRSENNSGPTEDIEKNFKKSHLFISGFTRSGTTLIRAILDVHPLIKCGPETKSKLKYLRL